MREKELQFNKLLARQIKRKLGKEVVFTNEMQALLKAISDSYDHFERDRKLIERAMERSSEELRKSYEELLAKKEVEHRNTELQQFVSMVSHDLKAPLRTVGAFSKLLKKELGTDTSKHTKEFLSFILSGVKGMEDLIENLLNYARGNAKSTNLTFVQPEAILQKVSHNCLANIEEQNAQIVIARPLPIVYMDASQLNQVFQNLVSNGIKFQKKEVQPIITIDCLEKDGMYIFSVKDNGIGISEEFQERVFGVFQRLHTKSAYDGTGLGLSICQRIVENAGGKIWLESEVGVGSTFYFSLPVPKEKEDLLSVDAIEKAL